MGQPELVFSVGYHVKRLCCVILLTCISLAARIFYQCNVALTYQGLTHNEN